MWKCKCGTLAITALLCIQVDDAAAAAAGSGIYAA